MQAEAEEEDEDNRCIIEGRCVKNLIQLDAANREVWEFFWDVESVGYEMASAFHFMLMDRFQADLLFEKFRLLKESLVKWEVDQMEKRRKN